MGRTKTNSEIVTDMMTSSVTSATQNCTTSSITGQRVVISNLKNSTVSGVVVRQNVSVKINCAINADLANKIQEDIATKIMSTNKETSQAVLSGINSLFGGGSKVSNTTKLLTTLKKDFSVESIQNMVNSVNSNQELIIDRVDGSSVTNVSVDQQSNFVADTISQIISKNDLVTAMRTDEQRKVEVEEKNPVSDVISAAGTAASGVIDSGGNAAGNVAKGALIGLIAPFLILIIFIIIIVFIYKYMTKPSPPQYMPPQYMPPQQYGPQPSYYNQGYPPQQEYDQQGYMPPQEYDQQGYSPPQEYGQT